jgi:hypothetical protein
MANAGTFVKGEKKPNQGKRGPAKATLEFKEAINNLLQFAAPEMVGWLTRVADGIPEYDIKPNPEKALDLTAKLAEYAAPKLARTEHAGDGGGPIKTVIEWQSKP